MSSIHLYCCSDNPLCCCCNMMTFTVSSRASFQLVLFSSSEQTLLAVQLRLLPKARGQPYRWIKVLCPPPPYTLYTSDCLFSRIKGELLFSSVEQVKLIHGHWLCPSSKMHHLLAQQRFEGIFGFVCDGFP